MTQQLKGLAWLLGAVALAFVFAAGLPLLSSKLPWPAEKKLGRVLGAERAVVCARADGAAALNKLSARLYPILPEDREFPAEIAVIPGDTVNAFAALGGRIYVYDGLLKDARSPEELAGVLAHELEHVKRRHIIQGVIARLVTTGALRIAFSDKAGAAEKLLDLSFSRAQERQADEGGLARLKTAKIDNAGFAAFFERAAKKPSLPAIFSDHPADEDRADLVRKYGGGATEPALSAGEWAALRSICR